MKNKLIIKLEHITIGGFIIFKIFSILTAFYLPLIILPPLFWVYKLLFLGTLVAAICVLFIKIILKLRKKSWPQLNIFENIWFNILFIFSLILNILTYPQSLQIFRKIILF